MIEPTFPLLKKSQTDSNPNSSFGLTSALQMSLFNGNVQFIIQVSRTLNLSFSIPTIACQIACRFFHIKCYINYDRFVVMIACMVLAFKLKFMELRIKDIVHAFFQIAKVKNQSDLPINQKLFDRVKDQIVIAQNQILRTLQYDIDVTTPHDYLHKVLQMSYPTEINKSKQNKLRTTSRIIILDSNRSMCSLYYSPLTICVSALLIASKYLNMKPYIFLNNKATDSSTMQKSQQEMYNDWLEFIGNSQGQKLKAEDILQCIKQINLLLTIAQESVN